MNALIETEKQNLKNLIERNNETINYHLDIMKEINKENVFKFMWHTLNGKYDRSSRTVREKINQNFYFINALYK